MKQFDILGVVFGSTTRVKVLKFFLLNADEAFSVDDIAIRLRVKPKLLKPELVNLSKVGFIKAKVITKLVEKKYTKIKKKYNGFTANKQFILREPLRNLLIESGGMHIPDIAARFNSAGKITLFVVSGIFLQDPDRSTDLMIVGDRLDKKTIEHEMRKIESEIGKELRYAVFDTSEFMYRLKMYDKLLRDIFDYPHQKVINKIDHPELRG